MTLWSYLNQYMCLSYFQTEPKRGIFARLYRLTRSPMLIESDEEWVLSFWVGHLTLICTLIFACDNIILLYIFSLSHLGSLLCVAKLLNICLLLKSLFECSGSIAYLLKSTPNVIEINGVWLQLCGNFILSR